MQDLNQNLILSRAIKPDVHAVSTITGAVIDAKHCRKGLLYLDLAAFAASATADVTITECATSDGTFTTHTTVAQKTAAGQTIVEFKNFKRYLKVNMIVGTDTVEGSAVVVLNTIRESKNLIS